MNITLLSYVHKFLMNRKNYIINKRRKKNDKVKEDHKFN